MSSYKHLTCRVLAIAVAASATAALAQPLTRYPMLGVSGGVGAPLRLAEASDGVARGIVSTRRGLNMSLPVRRNFLGVPPELMFSIGLVDIVSDYELAIERLPNYPYHVGRNSSPIVIGSMSLLRPIWRSTPTSETSPQWSLRAGPTGGARLTVTNEASSTYCVYGEGIPLNLACPPNDPTIYATQGNYKSFILNAGLAAVGDYAFTTPNDFFTGRVGLMASYYPIRVDQFRTVVRHRDRPFDGLQRWNRSSVEVFCQIHLSGKVARAYRRNHAERFEDEPGA